MDKKYFLFDSQRILRNVLNRQNDKDKGQQYKKLLEGFGGCAIVEDLPFYKTYLSRFDVERAFDGCKLAGEDGDSAATRDDLLMLYRFVAASFASSYDFVYDKENNSVDLQVTSELDDTAIKETIHNLGSFQIFRLFEIYLQEQIKWFAIQYDNDVGQNAIEVERIKNVIMFEIKVRRLLGRQGNKVIRSELDN